MAIHPLVFDTVLNHEENIQLVTCVGVGYILQSLDPAVFTNPFVIEALKYQNDISLHALPGRYVWLHQQTS